MRLILATLAFLLSTPLYADTTFTVPGGGSVVVPGTDMSLRLDRVTDQRCPAELLCFWEGMIRLELTLSKDFGGSVPLVLCNACGDASRTATAQGVTLTFRALAPSMADLAALGREPELADYVVELSVAAD